MIIDFHIHTHHSYDSLMKPSRIIATAKKRGLTGIVVCDHDTIKGGLEVQALNNDPDFKVIVGAEICTDAGDITGLFITKEIRVRDFSSVAKEIKNQGGLVLLNHPFKGHDLTKIDYDLVDLIEGYNARVDPINNQKAIDLALKYNKPIIAGSDAHGYSEIGNCRTYYDNDNLLFPIKTEYVRTTYFSIAKSQYIKAFKIKSPLLFIRITIKLLKKLF